MSSNKILVFVWGGGEEIGRKMPPHDPTQKLSFSPSGYRLQYTCSI